MKSKQPDGLIAVLLDSAAPLGDRDDAAMDLGKFDDDAAEAALATVACDKNSDDDLADSCGESLAEIWSRRNRINEDVVKRLVPVSFRIAVATLKARSSALADSAQAIRRDVKS